MISPTMPKGPLVWLYRHLRHLTHCTSDLPVPLPQKVRQYQRVFLQPRLLQVAMPPISFVNAS